MATRRTALKLVGGTLAAGIGAAGYAFGIEPRFRIGTTRYSVSPAGWPRELRLRIVELTDIHACDPWMPVSRIERIRDMANTLDGDLIVLLGDYVVAMRYVTSIVSPAAWSKALAGLAAPLGVHAVLGNHDWWDDWEAQSRGHGPIVSRLALEDAGIRVYENDVVRLNKDGHHFWLAGLADQLALLPNPGLGRLGRQGLDDLPGTLAKTDPSEPVILLAHEPDIFVEVPARVSLTLCGHTHGGQVRLLGYSPVVPSRYGNRFAYGHIVEGGRHLIVSGGLGCSIMPVRFGMPPEIVVVDVAHA